MMVTLARSPHVGRITWLGTVADRGAALPSAAADRLVLGFDGPQGEAHAGLTRPSCSRVTNLYPRGTTIRNVRQVTLVSAEELAAIAADMGLPALDPRLLGSTVVVGGIPDFTHVPPSSRLQGPDGATLVIDMENLPCTLVSREIEAALPGFGKLWKPAAAGRRGVTAWVEREGTLSLGEPLALFVPAQRVWAPGG
jgi:hypothetical protein